MRRLRFSVAAAAVAGGTLLGFGSAPASSATLPNPAISSPGQTGLVEQVQQRRAERGGERRWDQRRHGPRFRTPRPGYRYYHGGYYYRVPWWLGLIPPVVVAPRAYGLFSPHVQWCLNRYRTYDPATDTYVPRIGVRARCSSPYRP